LAFGLFNPARMLRLTRFVLAAVSNYAEAAEPKVARKKSRGRAAIMRLASSSRTKFVDGRGVRAPARPLAHSRFPIAALALAGAFCAAAMIPSVAQSKECKFVADDQNPSEQKLQCGDWLTLRSAHGTVYRQIGDSGLKAVQVDEGAVMTEFHPNGAHRTFQILTPNAIAAVRGTKWVVEVSAERSSTFVISGSVVVRRPHAAQRVVLQEGDGVDVSADPAPLTVKHWAEKRVQTLLARFGQ
jgi:ferric-dicitrate binding protein FerR (iron transport regulator)